MMYKNSYGSSDGNDSYQGYQGSYSNASRWRSGGQGRRGRGRGRGKVNSYEDRRERSQQTWNQTEWNTSDQKDLNQSHSAYWRGRGANWRERSKSRGRDGNESTERGRRGGHPSGLKGKDIGMWYARRSRAATKQMSRAPKLGMDSNEAYAINQAIDGLNSPINSATVPEEKPSLANICADNIKQEEQDKFCYNFEEGNPSLANVSAYDLKQEEQEEFVNEEFCYEFQEIEGYDGFDDPEKFIEQNTKKQKKNIDIDRLLINIQESDFKDAYKANVEGNQMRDESGLHSFANNSNLKFVKNPKVDANLYSYLMEKEKNVQYQKMLKKRESLPSYKMKEEILKMICGNQVVVLSGETGCGKTTQVAQFILDDCIKRMEGSVCRIVCTQPRRISAISVAQRVAEERAEKLRESVGYQIRLEAVLPRREGSILYCTTGIILKWLQSDPLLSTISHLILDEIHERDTLSDFLICVAKDLLPLRPDLKVVLMSATLNAEQFSKYYGGCPMIHIPGFAYNVKEYYMEDVLQFTRFSFPVGKKFIRPWKKKEERNIEQIYEDFISPHIRNLEGSGKYSPFVLNELRKQSCEELNLDLILALLLHISNQPAGAVLIFVPGWEQISKLKKMIDEDAALGSSRFLAIPLHSLMPTVNQREVFNRPPPGVRKIVIATNIAETSITIDDIVYVIDGGRIKMRNYDQETNISTLQAEWISLASATQRRGRAGRVQDGICYHLYIKAREMTFDSFPLPEIQRTRLEEVILQVKVLRLGSCKRFLQRVMESPEESVIDVSIKMLQAINALDKDENLTPLGFHLARLPLDPLTGKMLLMGAIFSCLSPILTVAASLSFKSPFTMSLGNEKLLDERRLMLAEGSKSDHIMLINVFKKWQIANKKSNSNKFVWENFLSSSVIVQLGNMRQQFIDILKDSKFINSRDPEAKGVNINSGNLSLVKAVITAGLYPNVARILKKNSGKNKGLLKSIILPEACKAALHPKSVNEKERFFEHSWLVYWEKMKSSKVYLHDTTLVSNYPLLLFGQKLEYDAEKKLINVDGFVKVQCDKEIADVIQKLRNHLDSILEYKISHPGVTDWSQNSKEGRLLSLIVEVISNEKDTPQETSRLYFGDEDDQEEEF